MVNIHKEIESDRVNVAKVLKPHLLTQSVIDADSGERHDTKRIQKIVSMTGTSADYSFSTNYAFTNPDSVIVTLDAPTTIAIYGEMTGGNRFTITAAESVTDLKIKVLMRGY